MNFPSTNDFLENFGLEPLEEDPSMAYCRYVKMAPAEELEVDISFSAVADSFQAVLRCSRREVVTLSSEKVRSIKIQNDALGSGVHVVFDIHGVTSEALVKLEPELNIRWWTLRSE
ncbi:hypothetical protein [Salinicola socius]|uniref:Uncharacterized protein n=1 Tax=Salinicola socius TaxID=404433 RepID=A0A1Q8SMI5_9GAMM|nr:hypothetical protein [Salinicola socius]OLO02611.1 hypothetical protein BTW07_18805 [Salinicola socius]OLO03014.1 hypothetical protein BTW07_16930 [Salinicola socius]